MRWLEDVFGNDLLAVVVLVLLGLALGFLVAGVHGPRRKDEDEDDDAGKRITAFRASEPAKVWTTVTAIAVAQAVGITAVQWDTWRSAVSDTSRLIGVLAVVFLAITIGVIALALGWFRAHRPDARGPRQGWRQGTRNDYPMRAFGLRQALIVLFLACPLLQSVTGIAAVAHKVRARAHTVEQVGHVTIDDLVDVARWRGDYTTLLATAVLEVLVITTLIAVAQRALLVYFTDENLHAYYDDDDPIYFGALLSAGIAILALPSWAILQSAGHDMVESTLGGPGNADEAWFTLKEHLESVLAPPVGLAGLAAALLGIVSPLATAVLARRFGLRDAGSGQKPDRDPAGSP